MAKPTFQKCQADIEQATDKLNLHHVSAITGLKYSDMKKLLEDRPKPPGTFFEKVALLFELHRTFKSLSEVGDMEQLAKDNDLEHQTVRLRKFNADLKEQEYKAREANLAPREDLELALSRAAQLAVKIFDGLIPEIEMLLPGAPADVIDAVATRIADARNAFVNAQLPK